MIGMITASARRRCTYRRRNGTKRKFFNDFSRARSRARKAGRVRHVTHAIALAIGRGTIDTGAGSQPLCEIELELERGTAADLFDVARELTKTLPPP